MRCKCYWVDSIAWTCPTAAYLWRSRVARTFVFEVRGLCFDDACSAALTPEYSFTLDPRQSATENRSERKGTTELRHGAGMQHRGRRHQLRAADRNNGGPRYLACLTETTSRRGRDTGAILARPKKSRSLERRGDSALLDPRGLDAVAFARRTPSLKMGGHRHCAGIFPDPEADRHRIREPGEIHP